MKTRFCVRRARGNHTPAAIAGLRSSHGHTVSSADEQPRQHHAADERAVDRERSREWIVVSVTISCSQRKYHGAFAGFGVTSALAGSSSGDAMNTARMLMTRDGAERDDHARAAPGRARRSTVVSGASSVRAVTAGDVPRATPSSV